MTRNCIEIGDEVMVAMSAGTANDPAIRLNDRVFRAKRKVYVSDHKYYWELEGAVSEQGVPYGFLEEELIII